MIERTTTAAGGEPPVVEETEEEKQRRLQAIFDNESGTTPKLGEGDLPSLPDDVEERVVVGEEGEETGRRKIRSAGRDVYIQGNQAQRERFDKDGNPLGMRTLRHGERLFNNPDKGYFSRGRNKQLYAGEWFWDNNEMEYVRNKPTDADTTATADRAGSGESDARADAGAGGDADEAADQARIRELREQIARRQAEEAAAAAARAANPADRAAANAAAAAAAAAALAAARAASGGERRRSWVGRAWEGFKNLFRRTPAADPATRPPPTSFESATLEDAQRLADAIDSGAVNRAPRNRELLQANAYIAARELRGMKFANPEQKKQTILTMAKIDRQQSRFPTWARVALSLGILGGGMAASAILAPIAAGGSLLALAAKPALAVGAAAANAMIMDRRISKGAALRAGLIAIATFGLVQNAEAIPGVNRALEWAGLSGGTPRVPEVPPSSPSIRELPYAGPRDFHGYGNESGPIRVPEPLFDPQHELPQELRPRAEILNNQPTSVDKPDRLPISPNTASGGEDTPPEWSAEQPQSGATERSEPFSASKDSSLPSGDAERIQHEQIARQPVPDLGIIERDVPERRGGSGSAFEYVDRTVEPKKYGSKEWWDWYFINRGTP